MIFRIRLNVSTRLSLHGSESDGGAELSDRVNCERAGDGS
jgi:hypothetical protein